MEGDYFGLEFPDHKKSTVSCEISVEWMHDEGAVEALFTLSKWALDGR